MTSAGLYSAKLHSISAQVLGDLLPILWRFASIGSCRSGSNVPIWAEIFRDGVFADHRNGIFADHNAADDLRITTAG
jgi:hypothetical protein